VPDLVFGAAYRASPGGNVVHAIAELALITVADRMSAIPKFSGTLNNID
jgi:hypothetical protein